MLYDVSEQHKSISKGTQARVSVCLSALKGHSSESIF